MSLGSFLSQEFLHGFARAGQRQGWNQPQLEALVMKEVGQRWMVVAVRFEPDQRRRPGLVQIVSQPLVLCPGAGHTKAPTTSRCRRFDQNVVTTLGDVDRYQRHRLGRRLRLGHGCGSSLRL